MKITIDTQHDRYEDIERAIRLLSTIIQQKDGEIKISEAPADTSNLMTMFDSKTSEANPSSPAEVPSLASLNLLVKSSSTGSSPNKIPELKPKVELY